MRDFISWTTATPAYTNARWSAMQRENNMRRTFNDCLLIVPDWWSLSNKKKHISWTLLGIFHLLDILAGKMLEMPDEPLLHVAILDEIMPLEWFRVFVRCLGVAVIWWVNETIRGLSAASDLLACNNSSLTIWPTAIDSKKFVSGAWNLFWPITRLRIIGSFHFIMSQNSIGPLNNWCPLFSRCRPVSETN